MHYHSMLQQFTCFLILVHCCSSFANPTAYPNAQQSSRESVTTSFLYTGEVQYYPIPGGAKAVRIQAYGAQGNGAYRSANYAGRGGFVDTNISLTATLLSAGQTLSIFVGGQNGWNGGGGGTGGGYPGGGGGGASDVRTGNDLSARIVVAGGGGGTSSDCDGGAGGGLQGQSAGCCYNGCGGGGNGGSQTAAGTYAGSVSSTGGNGGGSNNEQGGGGGGGYFAGGGGDGNFGGGTKFFCFYNMFCIGRLT